jgi:hypothetical protein
LNPGAVIHSIFCRLFLTDDQGTSGVTYTAT